MLTYCHAVLPVHLYGPAYRSEADAWQGPWQRSISESYNINKVTPATIAYIAVLVSYPQQQ